MSVVFILIIASVFIFVVTNKVLKKHIYKNKINLAMGAPICMLVIACLFFLVSYMAKVGADTLDRMRTPTYALNMLSGLDPSLAELMNFSSEYNIDLNEALGGESELTPAMSVMLDNVNGSFTLSVLMLILVMASYAACLYGVMKMNRYIIWGSLAGMSVGLIVVARSAGGMVFLLIDYGLNGNFNNTGDTSNSILVPFFTIIAVIVAIWCCCHGLRKSNALVRYSIDCQETKIPRQTTKDMKAKAERLKELKGLYDSQALTKEEFEKIKSKILNT